MAPINTSNWRLPWVSRLAFEQATARAEAAERLVDSVRLDANRQIAHAFEQSTRSIDQARAAIIDARAAMRDAIEMSKTASKVMFGGVTTDVEGGVTASSIRENDQAAQRRRDSGKEAR